MKLKTQINIFVICTLLISISSITLLSYFQMKSLLKNQLIDNLFDISYSVSDSYMVKNAFNSNFSSGNYNLNEYIEKIRAKTNVDFIVVMDMKGKRLTHPNKDNIGLQFKGGDEVRVLTSGEEYSSEAIGTLGDSVRVFVPIFNNSQQIGAVSVGSTVNEIEKDIYMKIKQFIPLILIGLFIGICCATILASNIKNAILGMEPKEIALMFKENEAIIENVREGIVTFDDKRNLIQYNKEAARILGLTDEDIGKNTNEFIKENRSYNLIKYGEEECTEDIEIKIRPGVTILCKYSPLKNDKGKNIGLVLNFRDLTEVKKLAEELTGIKKMAWSLRAQNHEFMNKLHTISGLIQLEEYDEAIKYISKTAISRSEITDIITNKIKNVSIAALLLAKFYKAEELRIKLEIDKQSNLNKLPILISEEDLGSVIGNLIENSFDAVNVDGTGIINFKISEINNNLIIKIKDNGQGIPHILKDKIYENGFSTKSGQRGYGMFIVKNIIDHAHGEIILSVDKGTSWYIRIPMESGENL
ncbi:MAG: histidine kinase [Bacillota bacterium]|nr:histidine kinase [Bacillota bacterium]